MEAYRSNPSTILVEADFTLEMMRVGKDRIGAGVLQWSAADAHSLPYPDGLFDAVVSGFLLRNVVDLPRSLDEQRRVLKPGGCMVALDTTRPPKSWTAPLVRFYMHAVIPLLGRLISGERDAYVYLPVSSESFLSAEELVSQMAVAGFEDIGFQRLNFGTIAIHWGFRGS
jgi:demethylmenaquinone methyltransferase/2-methoxy-6-polyprenyl-1,4-benzoquinol methylase